MANMVQVTDEDGSQLDARFSVDQADVILHSRGGAKGRRGAVNADYAKALLLLFSRLSQAAIPILGAWVDSTTVQSLPLSARSILSESGGSLSPERICSLLSSRMKDIRGDPNPSAKGGNSTKRIRIATVGDDPMTQTRAEMVPGVFETDEEYNAALGALQRTGLISAHATGAAIGSSPRLVYRVTSLLRKLNRFAEIEGVVRRDRADLAPRLPDEWPFSIKLNVSSGSGRAVHEFARSLVSSGKHEQLLHLDAGRGCLRPGRGPTVAACAARLT